MPAAASTSAASANASNRIQREASLGSRAGEQVVHRRDAHHSLGLCRPTNMACRTAGASAAASSRARTTSDIALSAKGH